MFSILPMQEMGRFLVEATAPYPASAEPEQTRAAHWHDEHHDHPHAAFVANVADDAEAMTCSPWDAYLLEIPPEVVRVKVGGASCSYDAIGVWHPSGPAQRNFIIMSRSADSIITGDLVFPLATLGDFTPQGMTLTDLEVAHRVRDSVARLIISTELEMSDRSRVARPPTGKPLKKGGAASSGVHRLLREVRVDCRAAMASYLTGEAGASPTVQTLVRGHFRYVAHGKGHAEHRWSHIEPYWRGPEDAPVAANPRKMRDRP